MADETFTHTTPSTAGSMWCVGAPIIVRENGIVWASVSMTDPGVPAYCNTHWELWRRQPNKAWEKIRQGPAASEREPCPLFLLNPKSLVISIQPSILFKQVQSGGEQAWYCRPEMISFNPQDIDDDQVNVLSPTFPPNTVFSQHSYRSLAVDAAKGEVICLVMDRNDDYRPTWRDAAGWWHPMSKLNFPIRSCYPNMVLKDRASYAFAVGDIIEFNPAWQAEKSRMLNRKWDYAFRRIFFTWTPDVAAESFREPIEIDSVDETAGWMLNMDMLVDAQGRAHLLWFRRNIQFDFMRDKFFPGQPITDNIMHAVVENGRVVAREALVTRDAEREGRAGAEFSWKFCSGRLHQLADGRLIAIFCRDVAGPSGRMERALFVQELDGAGHSTATAVRVQLSREAPENWFFTNTTRGGSAPSNDIDLLGSETKDNQVVLRYIHIQIPGP